MTNSLDDDDTDGVTNSLDDDDDDDDDDGVDDCGVMNFSFEEEVG